MKRLILMRHAKSSWNNPMAKDYDRPLNKRGRLSAAFMGNLMRDEQVDLVLCSSAVRTTETITIFNEASSLNLKIDFKEKLYAASHNTHLEEISALNDNLNSVMIVAHNPGISHLLSHLTYESRHMVTAAIAIIEFQVDSWQHISEGSGSLLSFDYPKNHDEFLKLLNA